MITPASSDSVWICVYKDTLGYPDDHDNLTEICVPSEWLSGVLAKENIPAEGWFDTYTADETEDIARAALAEGAILDCSDGAIKAAVCSKKASLDELLHSAASRAQASGSKTEPDKAGKGPADAADTRCM